ncbi:hypothetical protein GGR58DRAFT_493584 [Xylaria digitata]|nr:hypothetical protein GGR58DRAFT_493584 [Xylaria digitata]
MNFSSKDTPECQTHLLEETDQPFDGVLTRPKYQGNLQTYCSWAGHYAYNFFILLSLFSIMSLLIVDIAWAQSSNACVNDTKARYTLPPHGVLQFEERPEWHGLQHPWNMPPSDELDAVWEDLLVPINLRLTSEEVDLLHENKTDRLQLDNGDYVGALGVYHHLHCLNNIRRIVHWDYYQSRLAGGNLEPFSKAHSDHCIDFIRQALMCHANVAMYTTKWIAESHAPQFAVISGGGQSTCVKWESLNDWALQRALIPGSYKYLPGPYDDRGRRGSS